MGDHRIMQYITYFKDSQKIELKKEKIDIDLVRDDIAISFFRKISPIALLVREKIDIDKETYKSIFMPDHLVQIGNDLISIDRGYVL